MGGATKRDSQVLSRLAHILPGGLLSIFGAFLISNTPSSCPICVSCARVVQVAVVCLRAENVRAQYLRQGSKCLKSPQDEP